MSPATELLEHFFKGVSLGEVDESLLSEDMSFWSVNSGLSDKARFKMGIALLAKVAEQSLVYELTSTIEQNDRVAVEVKSHGRLMDGNSIENQHVFLFTLRDGKIAAVSEFMNQQVVAEKIAPLMQQLIAAQQ